MNNLARREASGLPSIEKARELLTRCRTVQECMKIKALAQAVASVEAGEAAKNEAGAIVLLAKARVGELTQEARDLRARSNEILAWAWADSAERVAPEALQWGLAEIGRVPPTATELEARIPKIRPRRTGGFFVYFVAAEHSGKIKIGCSDDPDARIVAMQTGCPVRLKLLATIPGGFEKEKELHGRFAHLRTAGEWFGAGDDLVAFLHEVTRG